MLVPVKKRIVLFEISPVDSKAQVTYSAEGSSDYIVFGNGVIDESGMVADRLEPGVYHYRITSKDYSTVEGRIVLDDAPQKHTEKITLRSKYGTLTLQTTDNAEILIDGEKVGTGSWSGALSPGNYKVECRLVAHKSTVKTIKVSEGDNLTVRLDHPTPITGTLSLMSSPLGAIVSIDGKKCGKTPDYFSGLLIGTHTITVSKSGYKIVVINVEIKENEVLEMDVQLNEDYNVINGHEYVDLGLPSGLKWATCNVGAIKPEEYGGYYAWGETEEKSNYDWSTYKWCNGSYDTQTKYCTNSSYGTVDNKTVLDPEDDVAHVKWGGTWRMPTDEEVKELVKKCNWNWTCINNVYGYKITGPSGNNIFLPAAGYYVDEEYNNAQVHLSYPFYGFYWSKTLSGYNNDYGLGLSFNDSYIETIGYNDRKNGHSIRPVYEKTEKRKCKSAGK